ncbi:nucleotidyltransferase domain-containing protein [Paenibacillus septentrionalis]|uniref:Nucleotidyltransferase domain-containing protein n=1 Tax=Paenibacillus septentrionalis TaxID=429342 RepID=A0ABW1V9M9_9BACL
MYPHHQIAINAITDKLKIRPEVQGVIIGGSVAHGFANESSDIDIMIVYSDEDYARSRSTYNLGYFETEACAYEGGYVDGKIISPSFIKQVAEFGSEPAKFAFQDAFLTYSNIDGLQQLVTAAAKYPVDKKEENMQKFYAQFETWKWYYYEGLKRDNRLLIDHSLTQYLFFAGRLILAYNEILFPSYKWFLKALQEVPSKPKDLMTDIDQVLEKRTPEAVEKLYKSIVEFHNWYAAEHHWTVQFMVDSQLNWQDGPVPVLDL